MAKVISKYYPEIQSTVETTAGGVANGRIIGRGENDTGLCNSNYSLFATKGMAPYTEAYKLYAIAYVYPAALHILVQEKSPIKTMWDMKGKKIAVGSAGGGTSEFFKDLLSFYNIQESDVKLSYISVSDGANALRDGTIDVATTLGGPPAAAAKELMETGNFRMISVDKDIVEAMKKKYGYYLPVVLPKAMFNMAEDVIALGGGVQWIVRDGLPDDVVYKMTKAIFDHLDEVRPVHPVASYFDPKTATTVSIPLHPGAQKYFREIGIIK